MADHTEVAELSESEMTAASQPETAGNPTKDPQTQKLESVPESPSVPSVVFQSPCGNKEVSDPDELNPVSSTEVTHPWRLLLAQNDHELKPEKHFFNHDVVSRLTRYSLSTMTPIILLIVLYKLTNNGVGDADGHWLSRLTGINIALLFTMYFLFLANQLHPGIKRVEEAYLFKVTTRFSNGTNFKTCAFSLTVCLLVTR